MKDFLGLFKKSFYAFVARMSGALLAFIVTFVYAKWLGAEDFGLFILGLTLVTVFSVISRLGLDQVVLKNVAIFEKKIPALAKSYLTSSSIFVFLISSIVSGILFSFSGFIANTIFSKPDFEYVLQVLALLVVPMSLRFMVGEAFKSYNRPFLAIILQTVVAPIFVLTTVFIFFSGASFKLKDALWIYLIGGYFSLMIVGYYWVKIVPKVKHRKINSFSLMRVGSPFMLATSGAMIMMWSDVIVLGIFGENIEVGYYAAASRLTVILSLISVAVVSIVAPKMASSWHSKDSVGLKLIARRATLLMVVTGSVPTACFLFFPDSIMRIMGEQYESGAFVLVILILGQFFSLAVGPVGYMLTMTGYEKIFQRIMLSTALLNILLSVSLVHSLGVVGVAYATTISIIIWNLWALYQVRERLGIWVVPLFTR